MSDARFEPLADDRRSIRLRGFDYSEPGTFFVTLCTRRRRRLFGWVVGGEMRLNAAGRIVWGAWMDLPRHYPHVRLDAFVVMPDHVHGVIVLTDDPADDGGRRGRAGRDDGGHRDRATCDHGGHRDRATCDHGGHRDRAGVGAGLKPAPTVAPPTRPPATPDPSPTMVAPPTRPPATPDPSPTMVAPPTRPPATPDPRPTTSATHAPDTPTSRHARSRHALPEIIRGFKTFSARAINAHRATPGEPVWQRNYYERVVRDDEALHRIRWYIQQNPARWPG